MENEIDVGYDPTGLPSVEELSANLEDQIKKEEDLKAAQARSVESDNQYAKEQEDPRNADTWGIKALAKEGQSILSGGLQDTASSLATFPERTIDALSGEMKREKDMLGEYKPEWQPFDSYDDPIITKTWWGKLLRGTVHFGSMAAGTVLAAKGLAAAGVPLLGVGAAKLLGLGSVTRAMAIGGLSDLMSKESDGHNALGALTERYGWIDTPLTTKETDHPIMMN